MNTIGTLLLIPFVVGTACHRPEPTEKLTQSPWVHLTAAWTPAPPESGMTAWVPAKVLRFKPDGSFSMVYCIVNKGGLDNELGISAGEGQTIFSGKWTTSGNRIAVEFRKIEESFPALGAKPEVTPERWNATIEDGNLQVVGQNLDFRQEPTLTAEYYDKEFDGVIAFHRDHPP